ncbi:MAG: PaaI family thioesterase [Kofleriaceae bacterium]
MVDGDTRARWHERFVHAVPHNRALGIELVEIDERGARFRLPWAPHLVGDPATGVLHGGAVTALLDACAGAAVFAAQPVLGSIATLDLRIDYLRPATPSRAVHAHAVCRRLTRHVAFVDAVAYHDDEADPIATGAATFMRGTRRGPRAEPPGG